MRTEGKLANNTFFFICIEFDTTVAQHLKQALDHITADAFLHFATRTSFILTFFAPIEWSVFFSVGKNPIYAN